MAKWLKAALGSRLVLASGLAVALAAAIAASPAPAQAATGKCGSEITYYSDATHTHRVGLRGWLPFNCSCAAYGSGIITSYYTVISSVC